FFSEEGAGLPDAGSLESTAMRQLAKEALWRACRAYDKGMLSNAPVRQLEDFAFARFPDASRLPEAWGLKWRRSVGTLVCSFLTPFLLPAAYRGVRKRIWW